MCIRDSDRQALYELCTKPDDFLLRQRPPCDSIIERDTRYEFADQQVMAVDRVEVIDGLNRGMVQAGEKARLGAKVLARGVVIEGAWSQHLDRDDPLQLEVVGAVHHAHAAGSD